MEENDDFEIDLTLYEEDGIGFQLRKTCANLYSKSQLVDVTLSCLDGQVQAHRVVLSSASSYLHNLFLSTPSPTQCSHPVIVLRKCQIADVRSSLEFIYSGRTQTSKNKLISLMEVGRELGLATLLKAIESAIQQCGIEMFRRMSSSSNSVIDTSRNPSPWEIVQNNGDEKEPEEAADSEIGDIKDICLDQNKDEEPTSRKRQASTDQQNPCSKSQRLTVTNGDINIKMENQLSDSNDQQLQELELGDTGSGKNDVDSGSSLSPLSSSKQDNGDSFTYTNSELNLDMGVKVDVQNHQNESGEDDDERDECELLQPEQTMRVPNNFNIQPFLTAKLNGIGNFNNNSGLELHQKEFLQGEEDDEVPASCPWCLQVFTSLVLLQRHIKTHVGNFKPFTCEYCQNTFARSAHLKRHLRTHTGEKPYQCSICQRLFARQDKLKAHLERHLQPPGKNGSNSVTIASYTSPSGSTQSSTAIGSQTPIKVFIPNGRDGNNLRVGSSTASPDGEHDNNFPPVSLSATYQYSSALERARASVTVTSNSTILSAKRTNNGNKRINGSPSPPTITPISKALLNQKRLGKPKFNFLK